MVFAWNAAKNRANKAKHGISFETAVQIFDDPNQVVIDNYRFEHEGEQRLLIIGMTHDLVLLAVAFVDREHDVIRIITARKATKYEEAIYADNTQG